MARELVIEARGLRKSYGATVAVDGLDLEMARGEVLSLLGPNGAGKTTTVEIFEGYRRRDAGEARVLGEDPQRAGAAWRARRGIVLQSCEDVVDLTVSECVRHFRTFTRPQPSPMRSSNASASLRNGIRAYALFLVGNAGAWSELMSLPPGVNPSPARANVCRKCQSDALLRG